MGSPNTVRCVVARPRLNFTRLVTASLAVALAGSAAAQLPLPASSQFDLVGFIQSATLDPTCAASAHCGGTLVVNGHTVTIPKETIVILPASALTWQELFSQAPAPYGLATAPPSTGLAMTDVPAPLTTYEVHVVGNRVPGATGGDQYIAGLVNVSQQDLNSGAGFINFMDYTTGEMRVGGLIGDPTTGTRVRINDPTGRYGRAMSPDARFTVDADNPTIAAGTGFPMCFPRTDPLVADDPLCPQGNRPGGAVTVQMNDPNALPGILPDARKQAPFLVGDYVMFAGTLVTDNAAAPTAGPLPANGLAGTYVSAHTITNNVAIYTWPGTDPAYVTVEVALIGTGGLTVLGAGEAVIRTRFEGMTTDPSRNIHLYGIDLDPLTGLTSDRDWGTIGVDPGPPNGAVKGRWRFRPPCTATVATDKSCTPPALGVFLPPTREMRAVIEGQQSQNPANPGALTAANGLFYGQYHAPIEEYIFPENVPGTPIVPNNFETIAFLAQGGYTSAAGTLVGQLNPWPGASAPTPACQPPVASAGNPFSVASGALATLAGSATGTAPITFAWTAPAGVTLSDPTVASPTFTAPVVSTTTALTFSLTATGCGGATSTASVVVTVDAAAAPSVAAIAPVSVFSGTPVSITASATDPGGLAIASYVWTQTAGPVTVLSPNPFTGKTISFTRVLPVGQVTADIFTFSVVATNSAGVASAPQTAVVTVNPLADAVTITSAEYRTSKQRLVLTATSSVVSPNVVLTLQPYATATGATFDPTALGSVFTNTGAGTYTLTLVGAPEPAVPPAAPLKVRSNLNGASPFTALTRIRP